MHLRRVLLLSMISACAFSVLNAQETAKTTPPVPPAPVPTFKQVFLNRLDDTEKKLVGLAEATPEEKYSWRPAEGVRSVSELFMHEAGANVFFMTFLGVKPPAGFDMKGEKTITEKAKVIDALKSSFSHVREGVTNLTDADMAKTAKVMGQSLTYEETLFVMANHMHEHLGQAIAYARTNGIVPPWSQKSKDS